jgi:excinuclease UvrABC nuclease subunit
VLHLVQSVRDEARRLAATFDRTRREAARRVKGFYEPA